MGGFRAPGGAHAQATIREQDRGGAGTARAVPFLQRLEAATQFRLTPPFRSPRRPESATSLIEISDNSIHRRSTRFFNARCSDRSLCLLSFFEFFACSALFAQSVQQDVPSISS